ERYDEQGEQQPAAMEAPAQEHAGAEDGVRVERREPGEHVLEPLGVGVQERREDDRGFGEAVGEELPDGLVGVRLLGRGSRHGFAGSLGTAAGLRVSRTGPRSTVGLRAVRLAGDIFAAVAVSSRGLGRSPLKAQTRVRIPLPLCTPEDVKQRRRAGGVTQKRRAETWGEGGDGSARRILSTL